MYEFINFVVSLGLTSLLGYVVYVQYRMDVEKRLIKQANL